MQFRPSDCQRRHDGDFSEIADADLGAGGLYLTNLNPTDTGVVSIENERLILGLGGDDHKKTVRPECWSARFVAVLLWLVAGHAVASSPFRRLRPPAPSSLIAS